MKYRWSCKDMFNLFTYSIEADSEEELKQRVQKFLAQHRERGSLCTLDSSSAKREVVQEKEIADMRAQLKTFSAERKSET